MQPFSNPSSYARQSKNPVSKGVSLSTYLPKDTEYFYAYPAGMSSGFLNQVSPEIEELVAARALCCAGSNVTVVAFAATMPPDIDDDLMRRLHIPRLPERQTIVLPSSIDYRLHGERRNKAVQTALLERTHQGKLLMAQPFINECMERQYQINPTITAWLNDKHNLPQLISEEFLPQRLGSYNSGRLFAQASSSLPLPFVAKASRSSAGDGVYICKNDSDVAAAVSALKQLETTIIVESFIRTQANYSIHFGIPADAAKAIDILGISEQLTSNSGEFLGGVINPSNISPALDGITRYLLSNALPKVRRRGWYGIGCFDVLLNDSGKPYIVDGNFRMTGMSAFHFLAANRGVGTPMVSFTGSIKASRDDFVSIMMPLTAGAPTERQLQIIALTYHKGTWLFNAALHIDPHLPQEPQFTELMESGITSTGLRHLINLRAIAQKR